MEQDLRGFMMRGRTISLSNVEAPCNGCADRCLRCRTECIKWQDYEQKKATEYEQRRIIREQTDAAYAGEARRYKNFSTAKSSIRHGKGMRGK